jgi:hypothetical protein
MHHIAAVTPRLGSDIVSAVPAIDSQTCAQATKPVALLHHISLTDQHFATAASQSSHLFHIRLRPEAIAMSSNNIIAANGGDVVLTGPDNWVTWNSQFRWLAQAHKVLEYLDGIAPIPQEPQEVLIHDVIDHLKRDYLDKASRLIPFAPPTHHEIRRHFDLVAALPDITTDQNPVEVIDLEPQEGTPSTSTASSTSTTSNVPRGKTPARTDLTPEAQAHLAARKRQVATINEEITEYFRTRKDDLVAMITNLQRAARDRWAAQDKGLQRICDFLTYNVSPELQNAHRPLVYNLREYYTKLQTGVGSDYNVAHSIRQRIKTHLESFQGRQQKNTSQQQMAAWLDAWESLMCEAAAWELPEYGSRGRWAGDLIAVIQPLVPITTSEIMEKARLGSLTYKEASTEAKRESLLTLQLREPTDHIIGAAFPAFSNTKPRNGKKRRNDDDNGNGNSKEGSGAKKYRKNNHRIHDH